MLIEAKVKKNKLACMRAKKQMKFFLSPETYTKKNYYCIWCGSQIRQKLKRNNVINLIIVEFIIKSILKCGLASMDKCAELTCELIYINDVSETYGWCIHE